MSHGVVVQCSVVIGDFPSHREESEIMKLTTSVPRRPQMVRRVTTVACILPLQAPGEACVVTAGGATSSSTRVHASSGYSALN